MKHKLLASLLEQFIQAIQAEKPRQFRCAKQNINNLLTQYRWEKYPDEKWIDKSL